MSTLFPAVYTEVEPATEDHGTQVVARLGATRVAVPYPHELSEWADIHAVALAALLARREAKGSSDWIPALFGHGVVWVSTAETPMRFTL